MVVARLYPIAGLLLLSGCSDNHDHDHPHLTTGEQLYAHHCASCHKDSGEGLFFQGVPSVRQTAMSYRELVEYIRGHGRSGDSRMPNFSTMPVAEAESIAIHVRRNLGPG